MISRKWHDGLRLLIAALSLSAFIPIEAWSQAAKPAEKVRVTVPAKSLAFLPFYLGQAKGIFNEEGLQPELIVMRPPLGIVALEAGDVAYSAAPGVGMRAALRGAQLRTVTFVQTKLSFSLVGQPGMNEKKMKTIGVSGIGSTAHYAAIGVVKKLGRGALDDKVVYITTNTTAQSYASLIGKVVDAAILSPPYTIMATLAGYVDLGDTFDVGDVQGGLVTTAKRVREQRGEVKAVIRAILRALDYISGHENEILDYLQRQFNLERQVAAGSYGILKRVYSMGGDIEEALLKSVIERMKKDSKITEEVPMDRIVDLSLVREIQSELKSKGRK
ncbi:MAG: ABC transporter substrate-binding protein [Deltaproteobacteria bacterium]|nr:ABC transporter substrate-binding protein [Deltaproteobacteria bacterium]